MPGSARGNLAPWLRQVASLAIPLSPLRAGVEGGVWRRQARKVGRPRSLGCDSGALPRARPRTIPAHKGQGNAARQRQRHFGKRAHHGQDAASLDQRQAGRGHLRPLRRRLQPGDRRESPARVPFASTAEVGTAVQPRRRPPFPAGPRPRRCSARASCSSSSSWSRRNLDAMAAPRHRRARQGPERRQGRAASAASRSSSSPAASRSC